MKTALTIAFLMTFSLIGLNSFAQDYSGTYLKTADTQLDGNWGDSHPARFQLYKVAPGHYRSADSPEGDVIELTIYQGASKSVFTVTNFRKGKAYFSVGSGVVERGVFKGAFSDVNGAMGNFKYVRQ